MILLIDNYDSFTWNLYQYFCELGAEVAGPAVTMTLTLAEIAALAPQKIVISPGPCTPSMRRAMSLAMLSATMPAKLPMLGVCLGHQAIAQVFGATIVRAAQVMHGKTSPVDAYRRPGCFRG